MNENYIRGINDQFIEDLNTGCLAWFLQQAKHNSELSLEIRKDYICIYYMGGRALRIEQKKNGGYRFAFDKKYCLDDETLTSVKALRTLEDFQNNFFFLLSIMEIWFQKYPKYEKFQQDDMTRYNIGEFCILDVEYAGSYFIEKEVKRNFRLDMLAAYKGNVVMIELKAGGKAMGGSAGIIKHYNDACAILDNEGARYNLLQSVKNITYAKEKLGLPTAEISREPLIEILFVIFDYNENSKMLENQIAGIEPNHPAKILIIDSVRELDYGNAKDLFDI